MVLSKSFTPPENVLSFLREFKALECGCCDEIIGFQHRVTGVIRCAEGCKGRETGVATKLSDDFGTSLAQAAAKQMERTDEKPVHRVHPESCDVVDNKSVPVIPVKEIEQPNTKTGSQKIVKESSDAPTIWNPKIINPFRSMNSATTVEDTKPTKIIEKGGLGETTLDKKLVQVPPTPEFVQEKSVPVPKPVPHAAPKEPERRLPRPLHEPKRFMWHSCKFSENLKHGAVVKTNFVWNINMLQIMAEEDDNKLSDCMDKIYSLKAIPLARPPIVDEIVLGKYDNQYYRGRVTKVMGDLYRVVFVDYGDTMDLPCAEMYAVNEIIMQHPIYSACIILDGISKLNKTIQPDNKLEKIIFTPMQLEMVDNLVLDDSDCYRAVLWIDSTNSLNEIVVGIVDPPTGK